MATAKEERAKAAAGQGCLGKAADNEPVFILRAQDRLAPMLVDEWALRAQGFGCPKEKVDEARRLAQAMREWPIRKNPD
jgi:hypothetical protein